MADRNFNIKIQGETSSLNRSLSQASTNLNKFVNETSSRFLKLGGTINKLTGPLGMLGTGAGILVAAKKVMDLDTQIRRISIDSRMGAEATLNFKKRLLEQSLATGVAKDEMVNYSKAVLAATPGTDMFNTTMEFGAKVMQATGSSGEAVGSALGMISRETGLTGTALEDLVGKMYSVGQAAGTEMNLAKFLPSAGEFADKVKKLMPGADMGKWMGAAMYTGLTEELITYQRKLLTFDPKKLEVLSKKSGIKVTNTSDIFEVFKAIEKLPVSGQLGAMQEIFGKTGFEATKLVKEMDEFDKILAKANPAQMLEDAKTQAQSLQSALNRISTVINLIAEGSLGKVLKNLSVTLSEMSPKTLMAIATGLTAIAVAIGGVVLAAQGIKIVTGIMSIFGKGGKGIAGGIGGGGIPGLGLGSSPAMPMYVSVVGGGMPGMPGGGAVGGIMKVLGPMAVAAGATIAAEEAAGAATKAISGGKYSSWEEALYDKLTGNRISKGFEASQKGTKITSKTDVIINGVTIPADKVSSKTQHKIED